MDIANILTTSGLLGASVTLNIWLFKRELKKVEEKLETVDTHGLKMAGMEPALKRLDGLEVILNNLSRDVSRLEGYLHGMKRNDAESKR